MVYQPTEQEVDEILEGLLGTSGWNIYEDIATILEENGNIFTKEQVASSEHVNLKGVWEQAQECNQCGYYDDPSILDQEGYCDDCVFENKEAEEEEND